MALVDVEISVFSDEELISELECRGIGIAYEEDIKEIADVIFHKKRIGQDYDAELNTLIYMLINRIL